jgi:hypothetical protein
MLKSGLILGVVMLILTIGTTLVSPLCAPCVALFVGLGAGYLACVSDKRPESGASAKSGAIGGVGALIGGMIGGVVNMLVVGPDRAAQMMRQFGLPYSSSSSRAAGYYFSTLGAPCCVGLFDIAFMADLGALGGLLWYQISGKKLTTPLMP